MKPRIARGYAQKRALKRLLAGEDVVANLPGRTNRYYYSYVRSWANFLDRAIKDGLNIVPVPGIYGGTSLGPGRAYRIKK